MHYCTKTLSFITVNKRKFFLCLQLRVRFNSVSNFKIVYVSFFFKKIMLVPYLWVLLSPSEF